MSNNIDNLFLANDADDDNDLFTSSVNQTGGARRRRRKTSKKGSKSIKKRIRNVEQSE